MIPVKAGVILRLSDCSCSYLALVSPSRRLVLHALVEHHVIWTVDFCEYLQLGHIMNEMGKVENFC